MPEVNEAKAAAPTLFVAILVVGIFLLLLLYLELTRYYNGQELKTFVEGAEATGQSYSVIIHNGLTGRYSFNVG
ncbi:hypothetical protein [Corynebacterium lipophiloflavum]|uniref:hypothetical protein n=1 Tax=Corynebacterium lipophiloflavum TaxID=161889 RepID=UPI00058AC15C|nr:hypothetical protein [Corynebacterium lipophiloflavum]